jgi:hypothetical protein
MDLFDDTYSEEYRFKCELKYISKMTLSERRQYLGKVLEKRGVVALNQLKEGLQKIWELKKK